MVALHAKGKLGTKKERKKLIRRLSGYWGWIGGRINKIFVDKQQINKIHPSLAVKCFKLSLKLRRKNKKSSNGLGWALLFSGEVDESIKAFERDLKEINKNNPASLIGIGRAYQEKGEYNIAAHYLKEGAKSRFDLRYEELPWLNIAVLATCAKKLEYLAFFKTLPEEKLKMLKDALEIYGMLNKIIEEITIESTRLQETKLLEDEQNLFKLKWLNLNDYINSLNQFSNI
jgi:tetratricopeptide (TPR) repeat protein